MKLVKTRYPIHICLFDAECRQERRDYGMPLSVYFNFIELKNKRPLFFNIVPAKDIFADWETTDEEENERN